MEESKARINRNKLSRAGMFLAIVAILLLIGSVVFGYFYVVTEARLSLREAKNVKIALDMLEIEYYGNGRTIYDPARPDGLAENVEKKVNSLVEQNGEICLHAYNTKKHEIKYLTYETRSCRVIYRADSEGDGWKVEYLVTVFDYSDDK